MKIDPLVLARAQLLARRRSGVLTTAEADRLGVRTNVRARLIEDGQWRRISHGVLATGPDSWMQRAWAGVVIGGRAAVLGYEAVLHLAGLSPEPNPIPVFLGRTSGPPGLDPRWRFIRAERDGFGSPPRTRLEEAIIDVGSRLSADDFVSLVGRAVTGRLVTVERLQASLNGRARVRQRSLMADILNDVGTGITSALERRYLLGVETAHGLPAAKHQAKPGGKHATDNLYEDYGLIVEVDGRAFHMAASVDMSRDNDHMQRGVSTLRFTWAHVVDHPCETAGKVASSLAAGGWTGRIRRCPQCP